MGGVPQLLAVVFVDAKRASGPASLYDFPILEIIWPRKIFLVGGFRIGGYIWASQGVCGRLRMFLGKKVDDRKYFLDFGWIFRGFFMDFSWISVVLQ